MLHILFPSSCLESWACGRQTVPRGPAPSKTIRPWVSSQGLSHLLSQFTAWEEACPVWLPWERLLKVCAWFPWCSLHAFPWPPVDLLCLLSVMNHSHEYNLSHVELYCGPPSASNWGVRGLPAQLSVVFSVSEERFEPYNSIHQLIDILFNFSVWIFPANFFLILEIKKKSQSRSRYASPFTAFSLDGQWTLFIKRCNSLG